MITSTTGFDAKVCDLEDFVPETFAVTETSGIDDRQHVLFLMATYGEGEPTDNAVKFMQWLKNENGELTQTHLSHVDFSVFALGNKQYEHYCHTGRMVNENMEKLGARRIFEFGEGDDDGKIS